MAEVNLTAELRDEFGKGAARRIRRAHRIPAVLYGHGTDPVHISLPGHETLLALRQQNALLSIAIPDHGDQLALPKQVQRDPVKNSIEHVDLIIVRRGEKVTVEIAVVIVGDHHPEALVVLEASQVAVEAEATHIPTEIQVDVTGLEPGSQVLANQLSLPEGVSLAIDGDALVVNVTQARAVEEPEAEGEAAEAETSEEADAEADAES